jgi:protein-L-isoaspartate O-methyltransferase
VTDETRQEVGPGGLASALAAAGSLLPEWHPAYLRCLREDFLPDLIWPRAADGITQGPMVNRLTHPGDWFEAVYSDVPITTQWDDGKHRGDGHGTTPSSSNSMPSVVFGMLADLGAVEDCATLVAGAGTGWDSALLAARIGDELVTVVDVDPATARQARLNHERVGLRPTVLEGNALEGCPDRADFRRVLASFSIIAVPSAWLAQCEPDGVIVAPFGTEYGGEAVVRLVMDHDGGASGHFTRTSAFTRARQQRTDRPSVDAYLHGERWPAAAERSTTTLSPAETGSWLAQFVIGLQVPGVFWRAERYDQGAYTLWLHSSDTQSWATADFEHGRTEFEVYQAGPRRLWDEVERAYRWWREAGGPGIGRLGLTVTPGGRHFPWLDDPSNPLAGARAPTPG